MSEHHDCKECMCECDCDRTEDTCQMCTECRWEEEARIMIHAYPNDWTPKKAYNFSIRRIEKIKFLLEEISGCYDGVTGSVESDVDRICQYGLVDLEEVLKDVLKEGKTP